MDALTYAGQPGQPGRRASSTSGCGSSTATSATCADVTDALEGVDVIVNAAAESHVSKSIEQGGARVRDHQRRRHPGAARRDARAPDRAVHPDLLVRGVRHRRERPDDRGPPAQPALAVRGHQGGRRPAGVLVLVHVRPADHDHPAVQQLRALPAPREGHPALHHPGAHRPAADDPRQRHRQPRLAARVRHRRGDHGGLRGAARRRSSARRSTSPPASTSRSSRSPT